MKDSADLVTGLLRKAQSDLASARLCLAAGEALDTVCFHAQQAAEKCIKAYLTARQVQFPFIHNIEKLIELCVQEDAAFKEIKGLGQELTPYAVALRYDHEFWPTQDVARRATELATTISDFVVAHLPHPLKPDTM